MAERRRVGALGRAAPQSSMARIQAFIDRHLVSSPARFAIVIFTTLILIFTALLALPISSASGEPTPIADALFTAVSAICVTGLATLDMSTHWSAFGHGVVLLAFQVGGIGVLTLASVMGLIVSRRLEIGRAHV